MHHAPWRGPDFSPFFSETRCHKTASIKPNATASSTMAAVTRRSVCAARAFFSASVWVRSASRASPVTMVVSAGASSTLASAASLSADFSLLAASFPFAADDVPGHGVHCRFAAFGRNGEFKIDCTAARAEIFAVHAHRAVLCRLGVENE